jgi:hypothetical protein
MHNPVIRLTRLLSPDQVKGHVMGPSFKFDVSRLSFGTVSFDFLTTRTFKIINTCEISMAFAIRIPQDGTFTKKEFDVRPASGVVPAFEELEIQVRGL